VAVGVVGDDERLVTLAVIFDELQERGELAVADRRPVVPSRVDVHGGGPAELAAEMLRDLGSWQALEQGPSLLRSATRVLVKRSSGLADGSCC